MKQIWVIQARYEKNADDGISYFTDRSKLAEAVHEAEQLGGTVQVFKCIPVSHEVFVHRVNIELEDD